VGDAPPRPWQRIHLPPPEAAPIVDARPGRTRDRRMHEAPAQRRAAKRRIEYHRRTTIAVTPDVEPVSSNAHQSSGRWNRHYWPMATELPQGGVHQRLRYLFKDARGRGHFYFALTGAIRAVDCHIPACYRPR